jgi:AcrR family transcriptional regulator
MPKSDKINESMRKFPTQERAGRTISTIFEAAAQILQKEGPDKLTTNRIAERAGFSIGTVYQYFPNKEAILAAIAERERKAIESQIREALSKAKPETSEEVVRQLVRILIRAFSGRRRVRRFLILNALKSGLLDAGHLGPIRQMQEDLTRLLLEVIEQNASLRDATDKHGVRMLSPAAAFVLTRAIIGTIRAAVLEESPLLETQNFEDELVRLASGYLRV